MDFYIGIWTIRSNQWILVSQIEANSIPSIMNVEYMDTRLKKLRSLKTWSRDILMTSQDVFG